MSKPLPEGPLKHLNLLEVEVTDGLFFESSLEYENGDLVLTARSDEGAGWEIEKWVLTRKV